MAAAGDLQVAEWQISGPALLSVEEIASGAGFLGIDYTDNCDSRWWPDLMLGPAINVVSLAAANFVVADRWVFRPSLGGACVCVVIALGPRCASASQPGTATLAAWQHYVAGAEVRLEAEAARLRAQAGKEKQLARQVELNLALKRVLAQLAAAREQL